MGVRFPPGRFKNYANHSTSHLDHCGRGRQFADQNRLSRPFEQSAIRPYKPPHVGWHRVTCRKLSVLLASHSETSTQRCLPAHHKLVVYPTGHRLIFSPQGAVDFGQSFWYASTHCRPISRRAEVRIHGERSSIGRASVCGTEGCGFKSRRSPHINAFLTEDVFVLKSICAR